MEDPLLTRLVVPIANEDDMQATCRALLPHLSEEPEQLLVIHVIEKTAGYMDKAPLEARQQQAERIFSLAADCFEDQSGFETQLRYGPDLVDEILAVASEIDSTAIAFTPRESNRLTRLLSGDAEHRLVTRSSCPVLVFPESDEDYRKMGEN